MRIPPEFPATAVRIEHQLFGVSTMPEEQFFADRANGVLRSNTLPLPEGLEYWRTGQLFDQDVYVQQFGDRIFIIADTDIFGFSLHCYTYDPEGQVYRVAYDRAPRPITKHKGDIITMSNNAMPNLGALTFGTAPMQPVAQMQPAVNEGISGGAADLRSLRTAAAVQGYVAGYVVANAPKLEIATRQTVSKAGDGKKVPTLYFRETKPSRIMAVLISLPQRCVLKNGAMAGPRDVAAGNVDFNTTDPNARLNMAFQEKAAIAYIDALGGKLPEYAPTVEKDAKEQWSEADIKAASGKVSFVYIKASARKDANLSGTSDFKYTLKSTSGRSSLFTPWNITCLTATEHHTNIDKMRSASDIKALNDSAFYYKHYNTVQEENVLEKLIRNHGNEVWETTYTVKGEGGVEEQVAGAGSVFFSEVDKTGAKISMREKEYHPWWHTGNLRTQPMQTVKRLVKRELKKSDDPTKSDRMTVKKVKLSEQTDHIEFKPYAEFTAFITGAGGFITTPQLFALGERASKKQEKSLVLSDIERKSLIEQLSTEDMQSALDAILDEASSRLL